MIQTIEEHSVDVDLLHKGSTVLDAGCRDFTFTDAMIKLGCNVYPVDIDLFPDRHYYRLALSDSDGTCGIVHTSDPQGKHICTGNELNMMTIKSFSDLVGINKWDLIKLDIEGSEINILKYAVHPIARQLSVEFHSHCGNQPQIELDKLIDYLSEWYDVYNRNWENRYSAGYNYWDILFIEK